MLCWNVYTDEFNAREIRVFNIFDHYGFRRECVKIAKKRDIDFAKFEEEVRRSMMYFFWSKCEWEIVLDSWPKRKDFRQKKIDVYEQVSLNWDIFIHWLWENRGILKKEKFQNE